MNKITFIFAASIAAIVFAACASNPATGPESFDSGNRGENVTISANPMVIRDWSDRGIGEIENPAWLLNSRREQYSKIKEEFSLDPANIVRVGTGQNVNRNAALIQADVLFAAQLAQELCTKVLVRAGAASDSEIDDGEYATIRNAALEAKVTVAGFRQVTDFWQEQEVTNTDGRKQTRYVAYILYTCPSDAWDKMLAMYLYDIVGKLPNKKTQEAVAGMFEEFKADTRREEEKSEAQWRAEIEARKQAVENQQRLAMAQTPGGVVEARAAGQVAQTQAEEDGRTLRTAIRSGNPVAIAAATIGSAENDISAVAALAAAAGL
jgi:hypothetical protein